VSALLMPGISGSTSFFFNTRGVDLSARGQPKPLPTGAEIKVASTPVFNRTLPMKDVNIQSESYGWVLISKLVELTGYSDDAIRAKKKRGDWREGKHWRKAPDNRVVFHVPTIQLWMGGNNA
jgi:hypothetical protein